MCLNVTEITSYNVTGIHMIGQKYKNYQNVRKTNYYLLLLATVIMLYKIGYYHVV